MKAVLLALALSSSAAFAKTCFLVDGVAIDGKDYAYLDQSEGIQIDATSGTLKSDLFHMNLEFDKAAHRLTYSFDFLLKVAFYESKKLIIENADSIEDVNGVTTDVVSLGQNVTLQAHLYCQPN